MNWDDDVTYPEPFEPEDSWSGGAGAEPDDLDRRQYRVDPQRPHPADCACSVHGSPRPLSWWTVKDFGKERSSHASLGPTTVVAATPGDSEDDPIAPPPGEPPPFVPGGGAGDGAVPTTEMDDVETEPQCRACLRAWADCNCPAKGNA